MTRRYIVRACVVIALAGIVAACDGSSSVETTTTTQSTTTTSAATTTSSAPATTTTEAVAFADLVYTGGDVITMDPDVGTVGAIAITGDTITAVGEAADIAPLIGPDTVVVELDGNTVQPGFVDAHTHILTDMGGIEAGQQLALAAGITSLGDASIEPGLPEEFIAASDSGLLKIRTSLYLTRTDPCGVDAGTWYEEFPADAQLADRVRVGGVKIFADGGVCGRIAASEPWLAGIPIQAPYHPDETLTGWIADANDAGYQLLIHAQGDLAIEQVQDSYEAVMDEGNPLRHRIDHNVFVTPANVNRFIDLNIPAAMFGVSAACQPDIGWEPFYQQYGDRPNAINLVDPDYPVAWHGDDPSLPPIDPILELYSLVTRNNIDDDGSVCIAPDWMAGGAVDMPLGLEMMTTNSAYALRVEDAVGSLTPGKLADLVVLSQNLLTIPKEQIPETQVLATVIGGVTEYCAPGNEALCPGFEAPPPVEDAIGPVASQSGPHNGPELAFDGSLEEWSVWSSHDDAPQWIGFNMPDPVAITEIRATVYQNPPSDSVHEISLLIDGEWVVVETWEGFTTTGDVLVWAPDEPIFNVDAFRITTLSSESWPEWFDIEFDTLE